MKEMSVEVAKMAAKSVGFVSVAAIAITYIIYNHADAAVPIGFFGFLIVAVF